MIEIRSVTAPNPGPFTLDGTRSWIVGEDTIIDPGPRIVSHIEALVAECPSLQRILVTHRHGDHAPAALPLRESTGAGIFAPDGVFPETAVNVLRDGDRIPIGGGSIDVIATPGHTMEHVCFLTDDGSLFTGDTILGHGTTVILPPDGDMEAYLASLQRLLDLNPARIYPGHGPVREDATKLIRDYIDHRRLREIQILKALESGPKTVEELRAAIYDQIDPALHVAAEMQIVAQIAPLEKHRRVRLHAGRYQLGDRS